MNNLRITFCGDFVSFTPQAIEVDDEIKETLAESDLNYINVEAPLSDGKEVPIAKSGPTLSQSIKTASIIKTLGFNVVSLANNHIFDYGEVAAKRTANAFNDVEVLGIGSANNVYQVKIVSSKGGKVGFISACQREFGALDGTNTSTYGYAWINDDRLDRAIINAKLDCDYLFVCPHAGIEEVEIPLPEWRKRYRSFIDLGADAVIASHPHIVQGFEDYKNKRIYYSLGNFFFDRPAMIDCWHHGLMVTVTLEKDRILYKNRFVSLKGTHLSFDDGRISDLERLNLLLAGEAYEAEVDRLVDKMLPFYDEYFAVSNSSPLGQHGLRSLLSWLRRALKGYRDDLRLVNMMRCESHRWLYVRCLNKRCKNIY